MSFKLLFNRIIYSIPMLLITTFIVFSLTLLIPGDPALTILGENATPEKIAQLQQRMGLDQPIIVQYLDWLKNAVQGDLGKSIINDQVVSEAVLSKFSVTLQLVITALFIAIVSGMFFAVISIYFPNTWIDNISRIVGTIGSAIPNFWFAMVIVLLFSLKLGWFPSTGFTSITESPIGFLKTTILPALSLSLMGIAQITRHLRSSLIEVMNSDYIQTAYSKGVNRWQAIIRHAIQNAMLPVVTTIGILFGNMLGATVVIETVFSISGMGQLAVNAILQRDFIMLQGVILIMVITIIIINFITDIIYSILDPRIEY